jgi:hypothetical protein
MGIIILIIIVAVFLIRNDMKGESSIDKIIETVLGLGMMVIAFVLGAGMLMMIVSAIASL